VASWLCVETAGQEFRNYMATNANSGGAPHRLKACHNKALSSAQG